MNEWNRERRKLVIGFCVVCFLFALIIVVASLSRKYPKNEMTEYYTAGIQEMTFGEPVSFSELCPEFADFEKTHYAGKYTEREQLCKELWEGDDDFSSVLPIILPYLSTRRESCTRGRRAVLLSDFASANPRMTAAARNILFRQTSRSRTKITTIISLGRTI